MIRSTKKALIAIALAAAALSAHASLTYDGTVTNNVIYGSGNANGGFTIDKQNNVELGLRTHVRWPTPSNTFGSNGDGTYSQSTGAYSHWSYTNLALWNFDFSINSDPSLTASRSINALTYVLGIDTDPSQGVSFVTVDPLLAFGDNSFGNNSTAEGQGVEASGSVTQATLAGQYNLMQNSENLAFFDPSFDPTANGTYSFYLAAFDETGRQLARTDISVIVGTGGNRVPEPATLSLVGLALVGAAAARRRKA